MQTVKKELFIVNTIRPYITRDEPFGPIDSVDIDLSDLSALKLLFEQHNWNLQESPSQTIHYYRTQRVGEDVLSAQCVF